MTCMEHRNDSNLSLYVTDDATVADAEWPQATKLALQEFCQDHRVNRGLNAISQKSDNALTYSLVQPERRTLRHLIDLNPPH